MIRLVSGHADDTDGEDQRFPPNGGHKRPDFADTAPDFSEAAIRPPAGRATIRQTGAAR